eukprot:9503831-Pyramimonas_sp.AAC.6
MAASSWRKPTRLHVFLALSFSDPAAPCSYYYMPRQVAVGVSESAATLLALLRVLREEEQAPISVLNLSLVARLRATLEQFEAGLRVLDFSWALGCARHSYHIYLSQTVSDTRSIDQALCREASWVFAAFGVDRMIHKEAGLDLPRGESDLADAVDQWLSLGEALAQPHYQHLLQSLAKVAVYLAAGSYRGMIAAAFGVDPRVTHACAVLSVMPS